jgi:hypothetical protein
MSKKEESITEKPKAEVSDAGHLAIRVALSAVPVVGGAAKELFNSVIAPPLAKRQAEWIENIAKRLEKLVNEFEGFKIEGLASNDNFISTVFYATTLNMRNHQREKIEALENAVLNTALNINIEEDLQHIFLNFIDELTPSHLIVLKYFENPLQWLKSKNINLPNYSYGGQDAIFNIALPQIAKNEEFARRIIDDLSEKGLAQDWQSMHTGVSGSSTMSAPRILPLGRQFLSFIRSPLSKT